MIHSTKVSKTFILYSIFPDFSTWLQMGLIFPSICSSLSSILGTCSFIFSKTDLPNIFKPVLTKISVPVNFSKLFILFNYFTFISAFWFTGKAVELQIPKLYNSCGRKVTGFVFSLYKRIAHLQPSSF